MPKLTNSAKRYQDPEVFEQLAIEYAVGSMQGRARKRFEVLMDTHFYLRATVEAYENKFANLVDLLPDAKAPDRVWNNIEAHIKATTPQETKTPWWKTSFFKQGFGLTAMALIVSAVLLFNPMTDQGSVATAYSAVMESGKNGEPMAVTKIQKSDMKLSIDIMKKVYVPDDMELTLWCHPKYGGMPMKMGTISKSGKTEIVITKEEWKDMKNVGLLAVSIEKKGAHEIRQPHGDIILKGRLSSAD
jgi:anti-sigma-K factor RskA